MPAATPSAHASALLAMPPDHPAAVMAFWFAGSRESGADVQIVSSQFLRKTQVWTAAEVVVNRWQSAEELGHGLRRLGNPVAWLDRHGDIHLYVVATGLGGWAASRILHLKQAGSSLAGQLRFEAIRVLPLSWFWNISHLVRTAPMPLADGGMMLPLYFELGAKYPMAVRFDATGQMVGLSRISQRRDLLQPALIPLSSQEWLALMRDSGPSHAIKAAHTTDAGASWTDLKDLDLPNPDAAIAALALSQNQFLLAHNARGDSRSMLSLSTSSDGRHWSTLDTLNHGALGGEFSYPSLVWADDKLWMSYTDQRRQIAWRRYTPSSTDSSGGSQ